MDIMDEELLRFWRILNLHKVQYIMVGGFAVNMHGFIRATDDTDMWLKDDKVNRKNLREAFAELSYGDYPSLETTQFAAGWTQFYIAGGILLNIMTTMKGLENLSFDDCYKMASVAQLMDVKVPFLHLNHLLANKKAVNRPQDQNDIIELEKVAELQRILNKKDPKKESLIEFNCGF